MDYKDDLDRMDLSAVETEYESKKVVETPYQKAVRKSLKKLSEQQDQVMEGQVMQSRIAYTSAKTLYEKEQQPSVVVVPVRVNRK